MKKNYNYRQNEMLFDKIKKNHNKYVSLKQVKRWKSEKTSLQQ